VPVALNPEPAVLFINALLPEVEKSPRKLWELPDDKDIWFAAPNTTPVLELITLTAALDVVVILMPSDPPVEKLFVLVQVFAPLRLGTVKFKLPVVIVEEAIFVPVTTPVPINELLLIAPDAIFPAPTANEANWFVSTAPEAIWPPVTDEATIFQAEPETVICP
jgi:hypothetical protein